MQFLSSRQVSDLVDDIDPSIAGLRRVRGIRAQKRRLSAIRWAGRAAALRAGLNEIRSGRKPRAGL